MREPKTSGRGRILELLRSRGRTVAELAEDLAVSGPAVRKQLDRLRSDGLVGEVGVRRGRGRPAVTYGLTDRGEAMFRGHRHDVLCSLLDSIHAQGNGERVRTLFRDAGARLARRMREGEEDAAESLRGTTSLDVALRLLEKLGGQESVRRVSSGTEIIGFVCPLAELVREYPGACKFVAGFVEEIIGEPVEDRCPHDGEPICVLETPVSPS